VQGVSCENAPSDDRIRAFIAKVVARVAGVSVEDVVVELRKPCSRDSGALRRHLQDGGLEVDVTINVDDEDDAEDIAGTVDRSVQDGTFASTLHVAASEEAGSSSEWTATFEEATVSGSATVSQSGSIDESGGSASPRGGAPGTGISAGAVGGIVAALAAVAVGVAAVVAYKRRSAAPKKHVQRVHSDEEAPEAPAAAPVSKSFDTRNPLMKASPGRA
ncbi:unnamed protein product, partial [Symbiodinium sp. KB8]